jgi:hypothetical protein
MKSILTFQKWTKKMSKIGLPKYSLLTDFLFLSFDIYRHKRDCKKIIYDCNFLYFFCGKGFRVLYVDYLGENVNQNLEKSRQQLLL